MFKRQSTKEVIQQIHNSFNTAGDKLLAGALEVLNQVGQTTIEKAERLKRAGFTMASDVQKAESIKVSKELAERIQYYQQKYPLNKFITEEQVKIICDKYALVCAPVDRYKGFVPETKLKMIEGFHIDRQDKMLDKIKIVVAWDAGLDRETTKKFLKKHCGGDVFDGDDSRLVFNYNGDYLIGVLVEQRRLWIDRYDLISMDKLLICAPSKDMDLKGLKKVGSVFASFTRVTVPDPVVLQPCKDGYLIVAAWGDEASDPIVVNPIQN